jgi:hypothetical protein
MDAQNAAIAVFFLIVTFVGVCAFAGALHDLARLSDDLRAADREDEHQRAGVIDLAERRRRRTTR